MVSVRLSDDEYRQIRSVCVVKGARSISDLVRETMLELMPATHSHNGDASVLSRIQELDDRVAVLQSEVLRLNGKLGQPACDK